MNNWGEVKYVYKIFKKILWTLFQDVIILGDAWALSGFKRFSNYLHISGKQSFIVKLHCKSGLVWSVSLAEVFIYMMQLVFSIPVLQCPLLANSVHRVIDNLLALLHNNCLKKKQEKTPRKKCHCHVLNFSSILWSRLLLKVRHSCYFL